MNEMAPLRGSEMVCGLRIIFTFLNNCKNLKENIFNVKII